MHQTGFAMHQTEITNNRTYESSWHQYKVNIEFTMINTMCVKRTLPCNKRDLQCTKQNLRNKPSVKKRQLPCIKLFRPKMYNRYANNLYTRDRYSRYPSYGYYDDSFINYGYYPLSSNNYWYGGRRRYRNYWEADDYR